MDAYDRFCDWDAHHDDEDLFPARSAQPVVYSAKPPMIPQINAQPDPNPPALDDFTTRPAEDLHKGDYLALDGKLYLIAGRQRVRQSVQFLFTLYPVLGGRITTQSFYPRNWLLSFKPVAQGVSS